MDRRSFLSGSAAGVIGSHLRLASPARSVGVDPIAPTLEAGTVNFVHDGLDLGPRETNETLGRRDIGEVIAVLTR